MRKLVGALLLVAFAAGLGAGFAPEPARATDERCWAYCDALDRTIMCCPFNNPQGYVCWVQSPTCFM